MLALLVSFNQADDFSLLPDRTIVQPATLPPTIRAQGNVYIELLRHEHYNFAQRTLLYAGRVLYTLIPPAPWSTSVRNTIAQGLRAKPIGSSADRIHEHYMAYLAAQPCISRSLRCPGV
jgi:hypothetical protein